MVCSTSYQLSALGWPRRRRVAAALTRPAGYALANGRYQYHYYIYIYTHTRDHCNGHGQREIRVQGEESQRRTLRRTAASIRHMLIVWCEKNPWTSGGAGWLSDGSERRGLRREWAESNLLRGQVEVQMRWQPTMLQEIQDSRDRQMLAQRPIHPSLHIPTCMQKQCHCHPYRSYLAAVTLTSTDRASRYLTSTN